MGSAEEAAATSVPTARMRGSSRRGPLLTLPPGNARMLSEMPGKLLKDTGPVVPVVMG